MAATAVQAAQSAGYVNAGTVEFLLEERPDGNHAYYFLEVNTRLQVEHPVTEMRTGLDLVRLQLEIAQGRPLPFTQEQIHASGHALEVRIYAEDAAHGFMPSVGTLTHWSEPVGPGIRTDSGVESGSIVSPFYDPMLAKLIVHAETRSRALERMVQALYQLSALGIRTNIAYLLAILKHPIFRSGAADTRFLGEHFAHWAPESQLTPEVLLALAAEALSQRELPGETASSSGSGEPSDTPWNLSGDWRNS
jgi:acetyl/propionyl-CoA carboxylase alpha subunit